MKIEAHLKKSTLFLAAVTVVSTTHATTDYGPAVNRLITGCTKWYTSGYGKRFYVIHDMEGYYLSSVSYLQSCSSTVSVHYACNGKQDTSTDAPAGEISQLVSDVNYAWHACCWNRYSMGTEHEGFVSNPAWFTDALYSSSAALTGSKASKYGFAKDRNHIVGHDEHFNSAWRTWASANLGIDPTCNTHQDPGSYWDWTHYMNLINHRYPAKAGLYRPSDGSFHLRNSLSGGASDNAFVFGPANKIGLMGDWDGDGVATCGYYDPNDGSFHLRNSNTTGSSDIAYVGAPPNMVPLVGDWDGDGKTSVGYYNPDDGSVHLRNELSPGSSEYAYVFINPPNSSLIVVTGDWDGDGKTSVGYYNPNDGTFHLRNSLSPGPSDYAFVYVSPANPSLVPVTGDWNGDGKTSIGYFNPGDGTWHLRNSLSQGPSDYAFAFGDSTYNPTPWW